MGKNQLTDTAGVGSKRESALSEQKGDAHSD